MIYHYKLGTVRRDGMITKTLRLMWSVTVWTFAVAGWMILIGLLTGVVHIDALLVP